jgi:putative transcriptional regulator
MKDMKDQSMERDYRGERDSIGELIMRTVDILRRHRLEAEVIEYPHGNRRSVDVVSSGRIIIKIVEDARMLSKEEIEDLKLAARTLNSAAIIISKSYHDEALEPGIVLDRSDISVMDPDTLDLYLSNEKVAIYYKKGQFYVKIRGEVLNRKRIERDLSIGELAEMLRISRKAIYEYEKGSMDPSLEVAQRLVEIFGEDIISRIDIHELTERYVFGYAERIIRAYVKDDPLLRRISEMGITAARLRRTAPDIVGSIGDRRSAFVIHSESLGFDDLYEKVRNTIKICSRLGCRVYTLVSDIETANEIKRDFDQKTSVFERDRLDEVLRTMVR